MKFRFTGFTLVELLIVIGVLAIISTMLILTMNPLEQIKKSNDSARKSDLAQIRRALELYYDDNGRYPPSSAQFFIAPITEIQWGNTWQPYMSKLPKDPSAGNTYIYYAPPSAGGQTYYLFAHLERGAKDPQSCNNGNVCASITTGGPGFPTGNVCGDTCNYGVTSTNVSP